MFTSKPGRLASAEVYKAAKFDDEYRKARLVLEAVQAQVASVEDKVQAITTIAQQFLVVDVAIVSLAATAAVGVKQIGLQLGQPSPQGAAPADMAMVNCALIGLVIFAAFAIISAVFAAICFLKYSASGELGPTAESLAKQGAALSAADLCLTAAVVWEEGLPPTLARFKAATRRLQAAVVVLVFGVITATVVPLVWH